MLISKGRCLPQSLSTDYHKAGPHMLPPFEGSLVEAVTRSGSNLSLRTANLDRYSSIPIYAPHSQRLPVNDERPCKTRWLSTTTAVPGFSRTQYSESAPFNSLLHALIASYLQRSPVSTRQGTRTWTCTIFQRSRGPNDPSRSYRHYSI